VRDSASSSTFVSIPADEHFKSDLQIKRPSKEEVLQKKRSRFQVPVQVLGETKFLNCKYNGTGNLDSVWWEAGNSYRHTNTKSKLGMHRILLLSDIRPYRVSGGIPDIKKGQISGASLV
jgi:hypothetical protein